MKKVYFSDKYGLTQTVLDKIKTNTRRSISNKLWKKWDEVKTADSTEEDLIRFLLDNSPYKLGEVVAVAQAYREIAHPDGFLDERYEVKDDFVSGWANKLFVRADLMPHQIRITNVRVERLQDISDEDCMAEGVELNQRQYEYDGLKLYFVRNLGHWRMFGCDNFKTPRQAYAALIDKISGKGTFESNPYVFVYEFELIK